MYLLKHSTNIWKKDNRTNAKKKKKKGHLSRSLSIYLNSVCVCVFFFSRITFHSFYPFIVEKTCILFVIRKRVYCCVSNEICLKTCGRMLMEIYREEISSRSNEQANQRQVYGGKSTQHAHLHACMYMCINCCLNGINDIGKLKSNAF